jgi:hypothetical protein
MLRAAVGIETRVLRCAHEYSSRLARPASTGSGATSGAGATGAGATGAWVRSRRRSSRRLRR